MTGQGKDPAGPPDAWATQDLPDPVSSEQGTSDAGSHQDAGSHPDAGSFPDLPAPAGPDPALARRSRRRRRRQGITFGVFFLLVAGVGLLMLAAYQGRVKLPIGDGKPPPLPTCAAAPSPTSQAFSDTSVNVFNASNRRGLALTVARELQRRGFLVPSTPANDPFKTKVTTLAVIRHGPKGDLAAHTLAAVVAGPVTYQLDERPGPDVDLVLGQTFALVNAPSPGAGKPTRSATAVPSAGAGPTCEPAASATP